MIRTIVAGDSYVNLRHFYVHELVQADGTSLDLAGYTIKTTYKAVGQNDALINHELVIDAEGLETTSVGLSLDKEREGVVIETLTSAESRSLPLDTPIKGDLQISKGEEVVTWFIQDQFIVIDDLTKEAV